MYHTKHGINKFNKVDKKVIKNQRILKELDCFVLDNSLRESTVGQLRGHTLQDKWKIFNEIKECGFEHIVVAALSDEGQVDDEFVRELVESGEDMSKLFTFVDFFDEVKDGVVDRETIPHTLLKMKKLKLRNPIIEIDLANKSIDWDRKGTMKEMCQLLQRRIEWTKQHICSNAQVLVNLRDFPFAMTTPQRVLKMVRFISSLDKAKRPLGIMYEDATGNCLPEIMAMWTRTVRREMNSVGWKSGHLLVHVHQNWSLAEAVQLDCLKAGADGIWASVCEEGAAFGHACSSITLMNLVRMGNRKVMNKFNCKYLRHAAIEVTRITTGMTPHPRQCMYGERALDLCFDFCGIAGGRIAETDIDIASFFCEDTSIRISTLSSTDMMLKHLNKLFGNNPAFTVERVRLMKNKIIEDLIENRKEEYMSPVGLALLFDRAGGHLDTKMREVIDKWEITCPQWKLLMSQLRSKWDELDVSEELENQGDDALEFSTFYRGFLQPYFSSSKCEDARKSMKALDMNNNGKVEWSEFMVYVKWAINEYPDINDMNDLLSVTFEKGLLPAMLDELVTPCVDSGKRWANTDLSAM